jgi:hypothetical protein
MPRQNTIVEECYNIATNIKLKEAFFKNYNLALGKKIGARTDANYNVKFFQDKYTELKNAKPEQFNIFVTEWKKELSKSVVETLPESQISEIREDVKKVSDKIKEKIQKTLALLPPKVPSSKPSSRSNTPVDPKSKLNEAREKARSKRTRSQINKLSEEDRIKEFEKLRNLLKGVQTIKSEKTKLAEHIVKKREEKKKKDMAEKLENAVKEERLKRGYEAFSKYGKYKKDYDNTKKEMAEIINKIIDGLDPDDDDIDEEREKILDKLNKVVPEDPNAPKLNFKEYRDDVKKSGEKKNWGQHVKDKKKLDDEKPKDDKNQNINGGEEEENENKILGISMKKPTKYTTTQYYEKTDGKLVKNENELNDLEKIQNKKSDNLDCKKINKPKKLDEKKTKFKDALDPTTFNSVLKKGENKKKEFMNLTLSDIIKNNKEKYNKLTEKTPQQKYAEYLARDRKIRGI